MKNNGITFVMTDMEWVESRRYILKVPDVVELPIDFANHMFLWKIVIFDLYFVIVA